MTDRPAPASPPRIYLQCDYGEQKLDYVCDWSWCGERINPTDVEYVRADEHQKALDRLSALECVLATAAHYRALRDRMAQVYGDRPARGFHVEAPTRKELDESWDALSTALSTALSDIGNAT